MKKTHLQLASAITLAAATPAYAQGVDKNAANFKEGPMSDYLNIAKKALNDHAEELELDLPDAVQPRHIFKMLGFENVKTYAQSSTPQGTEWINHIQLNNGGDHQGALKLFVDSKHKGLVVGDMAPAGTDLALQFTLNLASAETLIGNFMADAGAPEDAQEEFKGAMGEETPMLGVTNSELLKKLDLRLNLAIDFDAEKKLALPIPELGELPFPNLVGRIDGATWIWNKLGPIAIGQSGLPFAMKKEGDITTYTLPAEMTQQFMGFSPVIKVDGLKDQFWIATTPEFLDKCSSGENTLAQSEAYRKVMAGLPAEGVSMTYMSKDFVNLVKDFLDKPIVKEGLEGAAPEIKDSVAESLKQIDKVQTGFGQVISTNANGILLSERNVMNIEQQMTEAMKQLESLLKTP